MGLIPATDGDTGGSSLPSERKNDILPEVVKRYLQGSSLRELGKEFQADFRTLYTWLLAYEGEAHRETVTKALCARVADADYDLETALTKVDIARARERARFARMDYERRRPREYGAAPSAVPSVQIIVNRDCTNRDVKDVTEPPALEDHSTRDDSG